MFSQAVYEDTIGDSVKVFAKVEVSNTYCSLLIHQASNFIVEFYRTESCVDVVLRDVF